MSNGIAQVHTVGNYTISETETIRGIDLRRFAVQKRGAKKPYVVTMQSRRHMQCSCPAGCNQLKCKHLGLVKSVYS